MQTISSIEPALLPSSNTKIESSIQAFDEYINSNLLMKGFTTAPSKVCALCTSSMLCLPFQTLSCKTQLPVTMVQSTDRTF